MQASFSQVALLEEGLGHAYYVVHLRGSPQDFGWHFIRRPRLFSILRRRRRTTQLADVQRVYNHMARTVAVQISHLTVSSVFNASTVEVLQAENKLRIKRKLPQVEVCSPDWKYLLTETQRDYLDKYTLMWKQEIKTNPTEDAGCLFDLSQDPDHRRMWSGAKRQIPTLRHAGNILWSASLGRWILASELALAMGYPVTECAARAAQCDQDVSRSWFSLLVFLFAVRSLSRLKKEAFFVEIDQVITGALVRASDLGNAIHVLHSALVMMAVSSNVE